MCRELSVSAADRRTTARGSHPSQPARKRRRREPPLWQTFERAEREDLLGAVVDRGVGDWGSYADGTKMICEIIACRMVQTPQGGGLTLITCCRQSIAMGGHSRCLWACLCQ